MNLYTGLLFQQGYIQDPKLALSLASDATPRKEQEAPQAPSGLARQVRAERRATFKRGAIFGVCSTALSPFR